MNVAARLERANRLYGTQTLISETTAQAIGSQFELREIDTISLKGKTETTRVFELLSAPGVQPSAEMLRLREFYEQGLRSYAAQDWDPAESSFRECLLLRPNDGPSRVLLDRIQQLRRDPPGNDWKGVWQLEEK